MATLSSTGLAHMELERVGRALGLCDLWEGKGLGSLPRGGMWPSNLALLILKCGMVVSEIKVQIMAAFC